MNENTAVVLPLSCKYVITEVITYLLDDAKVQQTLGRSQLLGYRLRRHVPGDIFQVVSNVKSEWTQPRRAQNFDVLDNFVPKRHGSQ